MKSSPAVRIAKVLVVISVVWGTLAFGATYEWASRSMAVLALLACLFGWLAARRAPAVGPLLLVAMAVVSLAIGAQLIPLSQSTLAQFHPARHALLRNLSIAYRFDPSFAHPLSINPEMTTWALVLCLVMFGWIIGLSKLLSLTGSRWLATALTVLGFGIAFEGIVQNALDNGKIYGFWTPITEYFGAFGPFINKNHFAGWMLMVVPVSVGLIVQRAGRGLAGWQPTSRDTLLWLSSKPAAKWLMIVAATGLMVLAQLLTLSRSGIGAMALSILVLMVVVARQRMTGRARVWLVAIPLAMLVMAVAVVGPDQIAHRYLISSKDELRPAAWADAVEIGRQFTPFGTGLNTYGTATSLLQNRLLYWHFAQAHNDYLQLWVEGGALLLVPAGLWIVAFGLRVRSRLREQEEFDWIRLGAIVGIVAILIQEAVEFSLQMPGNLLVFSTLCAIAIYKAPRRRRSDPRVEGRR